MLYSGFSRRFVRFQRSFQRRISTRVSKEAKQRSVLVVLSLSTGFVVGRLSTPPHKDSNVLHLPDGMPRACCENNNKELIGKLKSIVGPDNVLDGTNNPLYLKGTRLGEGQAVCIITPRHLHHVQDCVQAIVDADCVILVQGQNTGLTGGSVPHTNRPTVVISMKYLNGIFPLDDGKRVVCMAGVGLAQLSSFLETYFPDRIPHSQLGSTFLNPTTAAGVAFGSGGTQMRIGPAYTERALYLRVNQNKWKENQIEVINTLGVNGMEDRLSDRARKVMDSVAYRLDTWCRWISEGYARDMKYSTSEDLLASDRTYPHRLCQLDSNVSRFNADTRGPDFNRSEGKVVILATVHDTFPKPLDTKSLWIGFATLEDALEFRKLCLQNPNDLAISLEYIDRDAFDVIDQAGRAMATPIRWFGTTSPVIRQLWNVKLWIESLPVFGPLAVDKLLYRLNPLVPSILPSRVQETGKRCDHNVIVTLGEFGDGNMQRLFDSIERFVSKHSDAEMHECNVKVLNAFRFVAAPAFRTWCVGNSYQGISVDYALPKNNGRAPPMTGEATPIKRMRYSHFGCNVVHEDLAYAPGVDVHQAKHDLKTTVEQLNGRLPAEHGHGTEYVAPKETQERWKKMDPLNVLNPGVGGLPEAYRYGE